MTWTLQEREKIEELAQGVKSLDSAIRGHNGEMGLLAKVDRIENNLTHHMQTEAGCAIRSVVTTLQGDPSKGLDAKGLVDVVNSHSEFIGNIKKWTYGLIATTTTAVILIIIDLIKSALLK